MTPPCPIGPKPNTQFRRSDRCSHSPERHRYLGLIGTSFLVLAASRSLGRLCKLSRPLRWLGFESSASGGAILVLARPEIVAGKRSPASGRSGSRRLIRNSQSAAKRCAARQHPPTPG